MADDLVGAIRSLNAPGLLSQLSPQAAGFVQLLGAGLDSALAAGTAAAESALEEVASSVSSEVVGAMASAIGATAADMAKDMADVIPVIGPCISFIVDAAQAGSAVATPAETAQAEAQQAQEVYVPVASPPGAKQTLPCDLWGSGSSVGAILVACGEYPWARLPLLLPALEIEGVVPYQTPAMVGPPAEVQRVLRALRLAMMARVDQADGGLAFWPPYIDLVTRAVAANQIDYDLWGNCIIAASRDPSLDVLSRDPTIIDPWVIRGWAVKYDQRPGLEFQGLVAGWQATTRLDPRTDGKKILAALQAAHAHLIARTSAPAPAPALTPGRGIFANPAFARGRPALIAGSGVAARGKAARPAFVGVGHVRPHAAKGGGTVFSVRTDEQGIVHITSNGAEDAPTLPANDPRWPRVLVWRELAFREADAAGVPRSWCLAFILAESAGRPEVVSGAGAVGLMQVIPSLFHLGRAEAADPATNIRAGCSLLARCRATGLDLVKSASRYNAGASADGQPHPGPPPWGLRGDGAYIGRVVAASNRLILEGVSGVPVPPSAPSSGPSSQVGSAATGALGAALGFGALWLAKAGKWI